MGATVRGQSKPRRLARQDDRSLEPQSHDMGAGGRYGKSRVIARTTGVYRSLESWPGQAHERPARFVLIMPPSPWRRLHAQFDDGAPPSLRAAQNQIEAVLAPAPAVV